MKLILIFLIFVFPVFSNELITFHEINLSKTEIKFFSNKLNPEFFKDFHKLKQELEKTNGNLLFAMNGGMFHSNYEPVGLYVENGKVLSPINYAKGEGNFFLIPNGVFYITDKNTAGLQETTQFSMNTNIRYATQSGPMLIINGRIHPKFNKYSKNKQIRNGVGILENGNILFAISNTKISFYEFANFFKKKNCKNALYLDGVISEMYLPEKNRTGMKGEFAILILEFQ